MKIFSFFTAAFLVFSANVFAADQEYNNNYSGQNSLGKFSDKKPSEGFFIDPFLSVEYSAPNISGGGVNSDSFKTNAFETQLKNFENIAIGLHFRVHKNLGFNINWVQTELDSGSLQGTALSQKASYKLGHYNFSALFFAPKMDLIEFFAELGASDMNSKLTYVDATGNAVDRRTHKTSVLYGAGFQITPFNNSKDAIRFSFQKYAGGMPSLHESDLTTVRVGYLMYF
jgi:hypothetical protein